jgi:hypothetical protein
VTGPAKRSHAPSLVITGLGARVILGKVRLTVDWLHLAGPRYLRSEDRSFFRPLVDLEPGTLSESHG